MILLKGHLILEQALNELLGFYIHEEKKLESLNLMFAKKLGLLAALHGNDEYLEEHITLLKELNRIRNKLAHKLDFDDYHDDLQKWACSISGDAPEIEGEESSYRSILINALYQMAAILGGYANGYKAARKKSNMRRISIRMVAWREALHNHADQTDFAR